MKTLFSKKNERKQFIIPAHIFSQLFGNLENFEAKFFQELKEKILYNCVRRLKCLEADFLDVIGTKVFRVFLLAIHSHPSPPPLPSKSGLKLVCNVNIVYGNLKSENSQDNAQNRNLNEIVRS